ncbi:Protein kinase domain [Trinorchestia longiramus]|nr:Protein kinase domain [Trinorchestia longiramus]
MADLSDFQRGQIVGTRMTGASVTETARMLGVSIGTGSKIMTAFEREGRTSSAKHRSDGKSKLSERDHRTRNRIVREDLTDPRSSKKVALKKMPNVFQSLMSSKRVFRELRMLCFFRHENVLSALDILQPPALETFQEIYVMTELMESDLHKIIVSPQNLSSDHIKIFLYQILRGQYSTGYSEVSTLPDTQRSVLYQILRGLKYLHSARIIHRDIKPGNLLVNSNCILKICDFGLARVVEDDCNREMTQEVVTQYYRGPELLMGAKYYTQAVDIWSVGCIFGELLGRRILFQAATPIQQVMLALLPGDRLLPVLCASSYLLHLVLFIVQQQQLPTIAWMFLFCCSGNFSDSVGPHHSKFDVIPQLDRITDLLGTPDPHEVRHAAEGARNHVLRRPRKPQAINTLYNLGPNATQEAIHLLSVMLAFDYDKRFSVLDCLDHPYLDEGRLRYHSCMCCCCGPDASFSPQHRSSDPVRGWEDSIRKTPGFRGANNPNLEPTAPEPFKHTYEDEIRSLGEVKDRMHKFISKQMNRDRVPVCINPQSAAYKSFSRYSFVLFLTLAVAVSILLSLCSSPSRCLCIHLHLVSVSISILLSLYPSPSCCLGIHLHLVSLSISILFSWYPSPSCFLGIHLHLVLYASYPLQVLVCSVHLPCGLCIHLHLIVAGREAGAETGTVSLDLSSYSAHSVLTNSLESAA